MSAQSTGGYRCSECGTTFNSQVELDAHVRQRHNSHSENT
jgi:DNA-directed RNA polymerase subunit RPC12/RpoP